MKRQSTAKNAAENTVQVGGGKYTLEELKQVLDIIKRHHDGEVCEKTLLLFAGITKYIVPSEYIKIAEEQGLTVTKKKNERFSAEELDELLALARKENPNQCAIRRLVECIMPKVASVYNKKKGAIEFDELVSESYVKMSDLIADKEKIDKPVEIYGRRSKDIVDDLVYFLYNHFGFSATTLRHLKQLDAFENCFYMENGRIPKKSEIMKGLKWTSEVYDNTIKARYSLISSSVEDGERDSVDGERRGNAFVLVSSQPDPYEVAEKNELRENLEAIAGEKFTDEEKLYLSVALELQENEEYMDIRVMEITGFSKSVVTRIKRSIRKKLGDDKRIADHLVKTA